MTFASSNTILIRLINSTENHHHQDNSSQDCQSQADPEAPGLEGESHMVRTWRDENRGESVVRAHDRNCAAIDGCFPARIVHLADDQDLRLDRGHIKFEIVCSARCPFDAWSPDHGS